MTYSNNIVKIDNWLEDRYADEQKLLEYTRKRFYNNLLILKTRQVQENFRKKITLSRKSDQIRFGSIIQLDSKKGNLLDFQRSKGRAVLAVIMTDDRSVLVSQKITDTCTFSVSKCTDSRVRSSFKIVSPDDNPRTDEYVKYGQDFCIQCVEAQEEPLLVYCAQKTANLSTLAEEKYHTFNRGELNLYPGLILKKDTGLNTMVPSKYTKWKFFKTDIATRFVTDAFETPVKTNEPVVITHSALNRNLCCESRQVKSLFGTEYVVSVNLYDVHKLGEIRHIWNIQSGTTMVKFS